ncbi:unnamed protein product [Periconia digitata]|uniref:CCHC-type domain-containing protein n=1 Tax=Periconia digitata TaxID=1303443 RepID=A0A9W4XV89_9PLEO|nr:unnamed protein product [Periconia digitata]
MGKNKKHRNGDQGGNRGGKQNSQRGGKQGGKQNLYCTKCHMNGHDIKSCRKIQDNNNRVNKKNNSKHNGEGNKQFNSEPCLQCGNRGHDKKHCRATEVPEGEECNCGCTYHRNNHHCPWGNDPEKRDAALAEGQGKICQWCKDAGDGSHVFDDCKGPPEFRRQLIKIIQRAYEVLKWCWHCSNINHTTAACTSNSAVQGKAKWHTKITELIDAWVNQQEDYNAIYEENDMDELVMEMHSIQRPPEPASFLWCIICEEFGHSAKKPSSSKPCNMKEFEARCPTKFRGQFDGGASSTRVLRSDTNRWGSTSHLMTGLAGNAISNPILEVKPRSMPAICEKCNSRIGDWAIPFSDFQSNVLACPKCGKENKHPHYPRVDTALETLKVMEALVSSRANTWQKLSKKQKVDSLTRDEYKKRASWALTKKLAIATWPDRQPMYNDQRYLKGKSPVFATHPLYGNGFYFNEPGNFQEYFPATKFTLSNAMKITALDDAAPINKAGRLGMELHCATCGARGMIADDENDLIMCGVDVMCTIGMGTGRLAAWQDEWGSLSLGCRCISIIGQTSRPTWVQPMV